MAYTKEQVLKHYNKERGTNFTVATLGIYLASEMLKNELRAMLREDAKVSEDAQINGI